MQPQQLRAILPPRIAAIMDRSRPGSSGNTSSTSGGGGSNVGTASVPAGAAANAGSSRTGKARLEVFGSSGAVQHRRPRRGVIPQVDGEGDEDEEDYVGDYGACTAVNGQDLLGHVEMSVPQLCVFVLWPLRWACWIGIFEHCYQVAC